MSKPTVVTFVIVLVVVLAFGGAFWARDNRALEVKQEACQEEILKHCDEKDLGARECVSLFCLACNKDCYEGIVKP